MRVFNTFLEKQLKFSLDNNILCIHNFILNPPNDIWTCLESDLTYVHCKRILGVDPWSWALSPSSESPLQHERVHPNATISLPMYYVDPKLSRLFIIFSIHAAKMRRIFLCSKNISDNKWDSFVALRAQKTSQNTLDL